MLTAEEKGLIWLLAENKDAPDRDQVIKLLYECEAGDSGIQSLIEGAIAKGLAMGREAFANIDFSDAVYAEEEGEEGGEWL